LGESTWQQEPLLAIADADDADDQEEEERQKGSASSSSAAAAAAEPPTKKGRRVLFEKDHFIAVDPNPNLIEHPPVPEKKQLLLSDVMAAPPAPSAQCRNFLSDAEKKYVESQSPKDSNGCLMVPDKQSLLLIISEGKANGIVHPGSTYEGIRSHLRKVSREHEARRADELKKAQAAEKKHQKKLAKLGAQAAKVDQPKASMLD
jgi:hypothetical protein